MIGCERFLDTVGSILPETHHQVPLLESTDPDESPSLIKQGKHVLPHTPRQTCTTCWDKEASQP